MASLLLAIIYLSFVSLGLPDSLLGSGWPVMQGELGVPLAFAGILTMIISFGTIVSSLFADRAIRKMGTGMVTALSVLTTAVALFGFSFSHSFVVLCLWSIPYGLGAGAVDAALNSYVAVHYSSRSMSWLHASWGVGVTISPGIMAYCLTRELGWNAGYARVGILQVVLTAILFLSLPLWKKKASEESEEKANVLSLRSAFSIRGVREVMIAFFCYCALESTAGLWASTYLVGARGVAVETAARFASLFYSGLMVGRFLNGFVADRFGDRGMIRAGTGTMVLAISLIALPLRTNALALGGLVLLGLGAAPVYPCIIHSTPENFGKENAQSLVGMQMASAYIGSTFMPPVFGWLAQRIGEGAYPFYLIFFAALLLFLTERMNHIVQKRC